jgi:hypothetical protein
MSDHSRAFAILRRFDVFLQARLRLLRAIGAPDESVFIAAVEELHRILDERLPSSPERAAEGCTARVPRMGFRPKRGDQGVAAANPEEVFVVDYPREMLCLARAGDLQRERLPARTEDILLGGV